MTIFAKQPATYGESRKLTGAIRDLKVTRETASFVFTRSDQVKMGVVAIAATAAGLGGPAIATASNASAVEEDADYLEFYLDDQPVKGWVWRNPPFRNGDVVDVAAQFVGDHWEAFGIARPNDRTVALYPHCSRGRIRHYLNALKWWIFGGGGFVLFAGIPLFYVIAGDRLFKHQEYFVGLFGLMLFIGVVTFSLTRQWLPFVRVAEKVFKILELPHPSRIDLVKSSKIQRRPEDSNEFGYFYFRY